MKKYIFLSFLMMSTLLPAVSADDGLFLVLNAKQGKWKASGETQGRLTLSQMPPHLLTFSEGGEASVRAFPVRDAIEAWKSLEKEGEGLSGALIALDVLEDDLDEVYLLKLRAPDYSEKKGRISFKAEVLTDPEKAPVRLRHRKTSTEIPDSFRTASLFFEQADELIRR